MYLTFQFCVQNGEYVYTFQQESVPNLQSEMTFINDNDNVDDLEKF